MRQARGACACTVYKVIGFRNQSLVDRLAPLPHASSLLRWCQYCCSELSREMPSLKESISVVVVMGKVSQTEGMMWMKEREKEKPAAAKL